MHVDFTSAPLPLTSSGPDPEPTPETRAEGAAYDPAGTRPADAASVPVAIAPAASPAPSAGASGPAVDHVEQVPAAPAAAPAAELRKTAEFLVAGARTPEALEQRLMTTLADPLGREQLDALLGSPQAERLLDYALLQRAPEVRAAVRANLAEGLRRTAADLARGVEPRAWVEARLDEAPFGGHVARRLAETVGGRPDLARQVRGDDVDFAALAANRAFMERAARLAAYLGGLGVSPPGLDLLHPAANLAISAVLGLAQDAAGEILHEKLTEHVRADP